MTKKNIAALVVLLFFAIGGCTQPLTSTRPDTPPQTNSGTPPETADAQRQTPDTTDSSGASGPALDPLQADAPGVKPEESILDEALELCQVAQEYWQRGEPENALEALDQAYALILTVEDESDPQSSQQKEDLRFMISKRILEIYASRNIVVNGHHEAIPLVINHHVQAEIDKFTKKNDRKFFIASLKRSGRYRPYIKAKLLEAGLPEELSWLPLIESGFKPTALSPARALGLWQFIPSTGYKFGLKRDRYIDERLDPIKSTQAAIDYLKELHQIFGDWTTVLAAYNCGEGRVLRVIRSQNINYLDNFWDLYERLPRETARYVPKFLATLHIVKNPGRYGMEGVQVAPPMEYEVYPVKKQMRLSDVSKAIGVPAGSLHALNPELRRKILPKDEYPLKVPPGKGDLLAAKLDGIPVSTPPKKAYTYHRIRKGETLSTIARRYGTSVNKIARANNINRKRTIVAGKTLKIPVRGRGARKPAPPKKTYRAKAKTSTHVVAKGDSLWILAKRYGTTAKRIQQANRLQSTHLHIGQVLRIPGSAQTQKPKSEFKTYRVKKKDSPYRIAKLHGMDLERFLRINKLTPRSRIYPGQTLYVE